MTWSCSVGTLAVLWLIVAKNNASILEAVRLLGWWPINLWDICRALLLTAILFTGPLFERGIAEGEWKDWLKGSKISESLHGWIGWRNYVAVSSTRVRETVASMAYKRCRVPLRRRSCFGPPLCLSIF